MRTTSSRGSMGLLIIIIFAALVVIGGLLFSSGKEDQPIADETAGTEPIAIAPRKINVVLAALGESIQTGQAVLSEVEGRASITAVVNSFASTTEQPVQIFKGTCANPGELAYALTKLGQSSDTGTAGTDLGVSDTVLDVSLDEVLAQGPLAIAVRKTAQEAHISVACGDIVVAADTATTTPESEQATTTTAKTEDKTPQVQ